jgi:hypothetical protein
MADCCAPETRDIQVERTPNPQHTPLDQCGNKAQRAVGVDGETYAWGQPVVSTDNPNEFAPITSVDDLEAAIADPTVMVGVSVCDFTAVAPDELKIDVIRTGWLHCYELVAATLGADPTDAAIRWQIEAALANLNIYVGAE